MRVADRLDALFGSQRRVQVHRATAGDEEYVLDTLIGDKLKDIVGEFHHFLS